MAGKGLSIDLEAFAELQKTAPSRRNIVSAVDYINLLKNKALTAEAIAEEFGLKLTTIKARMGKLRKQGYIDAGRSESGEVFYAASGKKYKPTPKGKA